jgi:hypothetical protein
MDCKLEGNWESWGENWRKLGTRRKLGTPYIFTYFHSSKFLLIIMGKTVMGN